MVFIRTCLATHNMITSVNISMVRLTVSLIYICQHHADDKNLFSCTLAARNVIASVSTIMPIVIYIVSIAIMLKTMVYKNLFSRTARSVIASVSQAVKHLRVPGCADHQVAQGSLGNVSGVAKPKYLLFHAS